VKKWLKSHSLEDLEEMIYRASGKELEILVSIYYQINQMLSEMEGTASAMEEVVANA
jgi:hypothetical protein